MTIGATQCAWCRREMKPGDPSLPVSHGICPNCDAAMTIKDALSTAHAIPRYAVDSSNVKAIGYERGVCVVEFANGQVYAYVMGTVAFEDFAASESKGRYFNQHIRGQVTGEKLTGKCSECLSDAELLALPCAVCGGVVRQVDKIHKEEQ